MPREALIAAGVIRPLGLRYDRELGMWWEPSLSGATYLRWVAERTLRLSDA